MRDIKSATSLKSTSMGSSPQVVDSNFTVVTNFYHVIINNLG